MIADLKPYPKMKDSGVEWLGDVPEHWNVRPNRVILDEIKDRDCPDEQMLSVTIPSMVSFSGCCPNTGMHRHRTSPSKLARPHVLEHFSFMILPPNSVPRTPWESAWRM